MNEIESRSNRWIKLARKLGRRRHRVESGLCLLEGLRLVEDAWRAGAHLEAVLLTPDLLDSGIAANLIDEMEGRGTPLFRVSESILNTVQDTVSPQGIVALAGIPPSQGYENQSFTLLLDRVGDPGNAGTLLRSAAAAGVELVLFGPESVDAFNPKVLRAGMGAHFRMALGQPGAWEVLDTMTASGVALWLADGAADQPYDRVDWCPPSALVVGGEARGAGESVRRSVAGVSIPMAAQTESLNAAVAGSVILFEVARQRRSGKAETSQGSR